MSCIATSPTRLQNMLDICVDYSRVWRFEFNASKSCIMQFSLNQREHNVDFRWKIGEDVVPVSDCYTHLGIDLHARFKLNDRITNRCRKGRNSYFAMNPTQSISPHVLLKWYKLVVLPTVLYGCELWNNMKSCDISKLNRFQHFIAKHVQNLQTQTRSDMCESLLGLYPIMTYIDIRKLFFLQKLCSLGVDCLTNQIFLTRLFSYFNDCHRKQFGFIPDIINILYKYELHGYLIDFLLDGHFPLKQSWKNIVINCVQSVQTNEWTNRVSSDSDFARFRLIHDSIKIWKPWSNFNSANDLRNSYFIAKLVTEIPNRVDGLCRICKRQYFDIFVHVCCNCTVTQILQDTWFDIVIENFDLQLYLEISQYCEEQLYQVLLGKLPITPLTEVEQTLFYKLCCTHIIQCFAEFNRATKMIQ